MLVTRGLGPDGLVASAGMGAKPSGAGPAVVVRNQWVRQWAIEQILANQAEADKRELEEALRANRKKMKQAPLLVVYPDDEELGQEQEPAKRQRRRKASQPATRAPRHDQSAASRQVMAGLYVEQAAIKAKLALIEQQVQAAYQQAVEVLDLEPVRSPYRPWAYQEMAKNEQKMLEMFTARVADKKRRRKQEDEALALMLTLVAA
jgi:hypothetical protein